MAEATVSQSLDGSNSDQVDLELCPSVMLREREIGQMTPVEKLHLKSLSKELFFLYSPPFFYPNRDLCGEEVHTGHVSKWSTFLIVETLVAAIAIQPLVADVKLEGWRYDVYGMVWMLTLIGSFLGLVVNAALLGHLLHCPRKVSWIWLCKVGYVSELPRLFMWISSLSSLLAIGYTTWILYGFKVGIPCVVVGLGGCGFTKWLMCWLKVALEATYELS